MINNITNVDAHLQQQMGVAKTASSAVSIPMPPILSFKTPLLKEKATMRVKKLRRADNIIIPGDIDDDYVDIVEEEILNEHLPDQHLNFFQQRAEKKKIKYLKHCYVIDYILSPTQRRGLGSEAIKGLAEKAMFDKRTEGRIVTFSTPIAKESSPAIFFYKLGFRFTDPQANEYIKECIVKNIPDIPPQVGMMYLPKSQLQKLLRYGDLF